MQSNLQMRECHPNCQRTFSALPEAYNNLGLVLLRGGRLEEGIVELRRAVGLKPEYAEAHYNLGIALQQAGELRGAREEFAVARRLNPSLNSP